MNGPSGPSSDNFCHIWPNGQTDRKPKEKTKTNFNSTHKFTAAAAFGAAALFSMLSFGGNAEAATSLSSCKGSTAEKVISCCQELTEAGRPTWMIESRTNCRKATVCRKGVNSTAAAAARLCYIQVMNIEDYPGRDKADGLRGNGKK